MTIDTDLSDFHGENVNSFLSFIVCSRKDVLFTYRDFSIWYEKQTIYIPHYGQCLIMCMSGLPPVVLHKDSDSTQLWHVAWCAVSDAYERPLTLHFAPWLSLSVQLYDRMSFSERCTQLRRDGLLADYALSRRTAYQTAQYALPIYWLTTWGQSIYAVSLYGINMRYQAYLRMTTSR